MIIELDKLKSEPCEEWLMRFESGTLDVQKAFKDYEEQYDWLYKYSDYDLIAWQIENGVFDWEEDSWLLAKHCPKYFNSELYNWKKDSWSVAQYRSYLLDPDKYNWKESSWAVAQCCYNLLNPDLYNWEDYTYDVETFCPHLLYLRPNTV